MDMGSWNRLQRASSTCCRVIWTLIVLAGASILSAGLQGEASNMAVAGSLVQVDFNDFFSGGSDFGLCLACTGSTLWCVELRFLLGVYPCVRRADKFTGFPVLQVIRFNPACAGRLWAVGTSSILPSVYSCVCRATGRTHGMVIHCNGLSLRVQGHHVPRMREIMTNRFIPACCRATEGYSYPAKVGQGLSLRVCRVATGASTSSVSPWGLSLRVEGYHWQIPGQVIKARFIPACGGPPGAGSARPR